MPAARIDGTAPLRIDGMRPPRIDAHHHFWRLARGDYGWLVPSLAPIYRDFGPDDLAPLLAAHGIERTVLVQAAPTEAETAFLLGLAAQTPFVAGVVGWIDFDAPDAADRIAALADDPMLVGLRPMVQDITDDEWLCRPVLAPAFRAMSELGLVLDALVLPRHLPRLARVVERHPELSVVVDHAAKPRIRDGVLDPWRDDIAIVANSSRVRCKLSGLVTEAGEEWSTERLRPYVDHLLATFGPRRLLWGSDWPVVELAGGYAAWRSASLALIDRLDEGDRDAVLGGNAEAAYLFRVRTAGHMVGR